MTSDTLFVLAILCVNVAVSEWLGRHTPLRHLGSALLVIVLTAVVANLGIVPTFSGEMPLYDAILSYLAPLAIFLLLLQVNLRGVLSVGAPLLGLFLLGSLGTVAGVLCGLWIVDGRNSFGELHYALGGMFTGTYTGGSINFTAIALQFGIVKEGRLFAGAAVVDSAMTTVWMAATVALPRMLRSAWRHRTPATAETTNSGTGPAIHLDEEVVSPLDISILLALGMLALWFSELAAPILGRLLGFPVPSILILTTLALLLAQARPVQKLRGAQPCGWLAVMLFLAVIGALCDLSALRELGPLGIRLSLFVVVLVLVHGTIVFGVAALLRLDPVLAAVASQANIGGGTSALALARSLGRNELVLPAILIGSLGNALGTYLGYFVAVFLR